MIRFVLSMSHDPAHVIHPQVRSVMGPVLYMLEAYEELYSKELEPLVEEILK